MFVPVGQLVKMLDRWGFRASNSQTEMLCAAQNRRLQRHNVSRHDQDSQKLSTDERADAAHDLSASRADRSSVIEKSRSYRAKERIVSETSIRDLTSLRKGLGRDCSFGRAVTAETTRKMLPLGFLVSLARFGDAC